MKRANSIGRQYSAHPGRGVQRTLEILRTRHLLECASRLSSRRAVLAHAKAYARLDTSKGYQEGDGEAVCEAFGICDRWAPLWSRAYARVRVRA